jgi:hypothetical protein
MGMDYIQHGNDSEMNPNETPWECFA